MLLRCLVVLSFGWFLLLVTGYGVLTSSEKNFLGMGLNCQYITGRGVVATQYLNNENGLVGRNSCPLFNNASPLFRSERSDLVETFAND